jgi:hypothetical protein
MTHKRSVAIIGAGQAAERELGLDDYSGRAPRVTGQSTQVFSGSGQAREDGLDFDVTYQGFRAVGVDTRLKVDDRLSDFRTAGGRFVVGHHRRNARRRSGRA